MIEAHRQYWTRGPFGWHVQPRAFCIIYQQHHYLSTSVSSLSLYSPSNWCKVERNNNLLVRKSWWHSFPSGMSWNWARIGVSIRPGTTVMGPESFVGGRGGRGGAFRFDEDNSGMFWPMPAEQNEIAKRLHKIVYKCGSSYCNSQIDNSMNSTPILVTTWMTATGIPTIKNTNKIAGNTTLD